MRSKHPDSRIVLTKNRGLRKTGTWVIVFPTLMFLLSGNASGFMPETSFLSIDTHPQTEQLSSPKQAVSDGADSFENLTSLRNRVINYEEEKLTGQRNLFLRAEKALNKGQLSQFWKLLPDLADYPLYPYLRFQYLKQRLSKVSQEELTEFFTDYRSQPVADMLRKIVLKHSASKGKWQRFLTFYAPQKNYQLQCFYLDALIRTGQAEKAYTEIQAIWLNGKSLPDNCNRIFKHWRTAGKLTPELVWQRIELALNENNRGLGRFLVRSLPASDRKLANLWLRLYSKPDQLPKYLVYLSNNSHTMTSNIIGSVAKRLASRNPQQAADILFKSDITKHANPEDHFDVLLTLAISLSRNHLPGAEYWFSQIPEQYMSNIGREWRVRTALRVSQWQAALEAMNGLVPSQRDSDRWTFWRARALEELGDKSSAMDQYTILSQHRNYYGFLAADRIGKDYTITDQPHLTSAGELFMIGQREDIQRAHELFRLDRIIEARREWQHTTQSMSDDERSDASKLAQLWGWAEQSILTMASTTSLDDMDLRFPLLFQQQVLAHSENENIDPAWTYGVIRRESAFVIDAKSPVGAVGLMQLMPATAKQVSRLSNVKYRNSLQLTQADTNLALGTHYLRMMLKRFDGQTVLATAAYNAGAHRIDSWLPDENTLDADRWIENIPFKETREYVKSVLAFTVIYADRLGLTGQSLTERMPTIPARKN